jgi:hypothetical protein
VRSASPYISRVGILAVCGLLLVGAFAGCSTTQEKAARQQAQSKRILEAREKRQQQKKSKSHDHGGRER